MDGAPSLHGGRRASSSSRPTTRRRTRSPASTSSCRSLAMSAARSAKKSSPDSATGSSGRWCPPECSTRGSTFPTRTWRSSLGERSVSANTSNASAACSGQRPGNVRSSTSWFRARRWRSRRREGGAKALLPGSLLRFSVRGDEVVPHFIQEADLPWLRALLDERERFVGRRQRELEERLREPLPCASPAGKRALAIHVLQRLPAVQRRAAVPSRLARATVFGEAARSFARGSSVLVSVATSLRVTPDELVDSLFADLPGERLVAPLEKPLTPGELALRTNLALAQGFLFRRTLLYGRALGGLVPQLAWCQSFRLQAVCALQGRSLVLELRSGDPIFPSPEPRAYDSRLEERFARDFRRTAPGWDVVREPEPVAAGDALVFPDFALQHRLDPSRRWLLEIVGFWTPEYLARKLASYRAAGLSNLILCIDEERNCAEQELPAGALVLRFRRRVDATAVHRLVDAQAIGPNPDGRHAALL